MSARMHKPPTARSRARKLPTILALALLPRLVAADGEVLLADPRRAGTRDLLAAARATFSVRTRQDGDVALHRLRRRERAR